MTNTPVAVRLAAVVASAAITASLLATVFALAESSAPGKVSVVKDG